MPRRLLRLDPTVALVDRVIMSQVSRGSRVLDLGCGDGRLLCRLRDEQDCTIQGVERELRELIEAVAKGVPVIQADLDEGLHQIPSHSFDFAVLSQTLQQVLRPEALLKEMLRVARRALVVVPNFGHWRVRLQILLYGRAPITNQLPYDWYNTPNLHMLSMLDFRELIEVLDLKIVHEIPILHGKAAMNVWGANLRADSALYVLETAHAPELATAAVAN
jgi:methionine biosynthesis protein MetW